MSLLLGRCKVQRYHVHLGHCLPSSEPSSPMIIFIEETICCAQGADIELAYAALCEEERTWLIIS